MARNFKLTGWHALGIFAGSFAIIFGANITLAVSAVSTFPGLETRNSYIESQTFDTRRAAQESLGWDVKARLERGTITLSITDDRGLPVQAASFEALVGRPTNVTDDVVPDFVWTGTAYTAPADLRPGNWDLWLKAVAEDGTPFEQRLAIRIGG